MRRGAALLALVSVAGALAGTAAGAQRFERHVVPAQGLSLAVPAPWVVVDSRLPKEVVQRLSRENPRLAPFLSGLSQPGSPITFIALDPVVRSGFATNVNVVVVPLSGSLTFAQYQQALVSELRTVGAKNMQKSVVTIGGVRAARLSYRFQLRLGKTFTVQTLQYAFLRSGRSVVVTYTTLPSHAARYEPTFKRSAASIRFS
jgi:uncharacterized membrane protein YfcA